MLMRLVNFILGAAASLWVVATTYRWLSGQVASDTVWILAICAAAIIAWHGFGGAAKR